MLYPLIRCAHQPGQQSAALKTIFVILVAWAAGLSHALPWLYLPLFVMYMNRFQIKPEEQALLKLFGTEYKNYCLKVRRWF